MDYRDIEERGFLHLKNIISPEDVGKLVDEYRGAGEVSNKKYNNKRVTPASRDILRPYYLKIMSELSAQTSLTLNRLVDSGCYFSTNDWIHDWHQDSLTYFFYQSHKDFVIIWTPIIKPTPALGNLSVFPYDEFKKADAGIFVGRRHKGAASFHHNGERSVFQLSDAAEDSLLKVGFNLNDRQVTPEVAVGDVVVMQGDLFHRTQAEGRDRVAISLYGLNQDTVLTRENFERRGEYKREYFAKNPELQRQLAEFFRNHPVATVKELLEFVAGV
jgi:ectoine hydroxylase-related dioxygenase (phytanoyl-CoA dioxygenase family)